MHYLSYSRHFDDLQPLENLFDRVGRGMRADDIAVGTTVFVKWGGGRELYEARVCEMTTPESGALAVRVHYDDFTDDWDQVSARASRCSVRAAFDFDAAPASRAQWVCARRIIRKLPNGVM